MALPFGCLWQGAAKAESLNQHHHDQLVVVWTANWNEVNAKLQRYQFENDQHRWLKIGKPIPVVIGEHGMAWGMPKSNKNWPVKKEGDGRTPAGLFNIGPAFGFGATSEISLKLPYISLSKDVICVDDPNSVYYNQLFDRMTVSHSDWHSNEKMRQISAYRFGGVIQYNTERKPGAGSCIFLHIWRGPNRGTAGCIAMKVEVLKELLTWLDPEKKPVIAVLPAYPALRKLLTKPFPSFPVPF